MLGWLALVSVFAAEPWQAHRARLAAELPEGVTLRVEPRSERAGTRVMEVTRVAPTGLPIAGRARWWVEGETVVDAQPLQPLGARHWDAPRMRPAQVRAQAAHAGYTPLGPVRPEHRAEDGGLQWQVEVAFDPNTGRRPRVWVDDTTGAVREGPDVVRTVAAAAFERNPVLDPVPSVFELDGVADPADRLFDGRFDVRQCEDPGGAGACVLAPVGPSDEGDFVFLVPEHTDEHDPFAAASIAVHAQRFADFAQAHGLPLAPCLADDPGILVANYRGFSGDGSILVANAGYTGDCGFLAFFGQGPAADWGYDADVVVHELTHGTVEAQMGAGRRLGETLRRPEAVVTDAGAVNEAIADFVAAVVTGDSGHAEYVRAFEGGWMRDADNDLRCPADLVGEIHFDAEPLTGALWEAHAELGDGLVEPVVDAIAMMAEDTSFEQASARIVMAVRSELGDAAATTVEDALDRHGLLDCERVSGGADLRGPLWLRPRFGASGYFDPMRPPPQQVRLDVPEDAAVATVTYTVAVVPEPGWQPVGDVHVLVQTGAPVHFDYAVDDEGRTTVDAQPDQHLASVNDGSFTLDVEPGSAVFLAFFNQGQHLTRVGEVSVLFEPGATSGGSSTGADSDDDTVPSTDSSSDTREPFASGRDGGCGVGGGSGVGLWALLFAWAGSQTRRRRPR